MQKLKILIIFFVILNIYAKGIPLPTEYKLPIVDSCENFAAKFSVDEVTGKMLLYQVNVFEKIIKSDLPSLINKWTVDNTYFKKFTTLISVHDLKKPTDNIVTYKVTLSLEDNEGSCALVLSSITTDVISQSID